MGLDALKYDLVSELLGTVFEIAIFSLETV